jgi:hypothetical protein
MLIAAQGNGLRKRDQRRVVLDCVAAYEPRWPGAAGPATLPVRSARAPRLRAQGIGILVEVARRLVMGSSRQ